MLGLQPDTNPSIGTASPSQPRRPFQECRRRSRCAGAAWSGLLLSDPRYSKLPSSERASDENSGAFPNYATWLERFPGTVLAFLWGFAEGSLFFILPDVPMSFVALFRPRRALLHMAAIVAGAVLAGWVMFTWSARSPIARSVVAHVPAVTPAMFDRAQHDLNDYGVGGTSLGPVRGIPYKVYAVEAPSHSALCGPSCFGQFRRGSGGSCLYGSDSRVLE